MLLEYVMLLRGLLLLNSPIFYECLFLHVFICTLDAFTNALHKYDMAMMEIQSRANMSENKNL